MQKYINAIADKNGKPVVGASVLVQSYPSGSTATIYSDNGVTPISNPVTTDSNGAFAFYAADGRYSLQISGSSFPAQTINDILLEDPTDGGSPGSFTTLTVGTSGTIAGSAIQTAASLGAPGTAAIIGSSAGTVQTDIDARPTSSSLAASGGAALVGFIQSGTGAVARTVQDKERDWVGVKDFGADPTGVTDAVTAFNNASASTTGAVRIKAGTYKLGSNTNAGTWIVDAGVTFTGAGSLVGNIIEAFGPTSNYIQRLIGNSSTTGQLIGSNLELGLFQTGTNSSYQFGKTVELWTPSSSATIWNGILTADYGSFNHFGTGALNAGYGGSFEAFNSGSATSTLIVGINGNAWNGGVAAGYPTQTPTNNGAVSNLRGLSGFAGNTSSGVVTAASSLYAATISNSGTGSITTACGALISDQTAGGTNYSIFTGKGTARIGDVVNITNKWNLPTGTSGTLYMASGFSSPSLGRIYVGDGSGWRLEFAKRSGGTDTVLGHFDDSGAFNVAGSIVGSSPSKAIGYATGAGGTITQLTSKTTAVTLNATSGQIVTNNASLAAGAIVTFNFFNSAITSTTIPVFSIVSGSTSGAYVITADNMQTGACNVVVKNQSGGSLAEAITINFALIVASVN